MANHLYARGPLVFSHPGTEGTEGITDLRSYLLASVTDEKTQQLLWKTLENIFTKKFIESTIDLKTNEDEFLSRAMAIAKRFGVLSHFLKNLCQQHCKPTFGVMIDNFIRIDNSRRLVTDDVKLLTREEVKGILVTIT